MAESTKFSLSLGAKRPEHSSHHHHEHRHHSNGTKRPHAALHDSDDEDGTEGRHQNITHFDKAAGGAVHSERRVVEKKPLVIPVGESSSSRKKQKSGLPSQNTEAAEAAAAEAKAKAAPVSFGLNVNAKTEDAESTTTATQLEDAPTKPQAAAKTADEEALAALLGQKSTSNTVIPTLTDEEVFQRDYDTAPDVPTESDYDAVPIAEFGAAMLRGMGWKDGEGIGRNKGQAPLKQRTLERRPELLGVGAKPAKALGIELGEWGKHAKKHERKIDQAYAPVMLKNKKTGEMITEEEMQQRLKEQDMDFVDDEDDESKRGKEKERERKQDREKDRNRDYDDRKHRSSRRERSASNDDQRRRRHEDDGDRDRNRNRDRDRDRDRERDRNWDRDRDRDRDGHERRRDKERSRRDRGESEERYRSRKEDKYRDKDRERRHRDDDRSYSKEKSRDDRSARDRR